MKKQIGVIVAAVLLFATVLSGCLNDVDEQDTTPTVEFPPLDMLSLKVEDLPDGYVKWSEEYNLSVSISKIIPAIKVYDITFIYKEPINNTGFPMIQLTLASFNSSEDAETVLYNSSEQMSNILDEMLNNTSVENVEQVGNISIYKLYEGSMGEEYEYQNATWSFIYFKIENIVAFVLLDEIPSSEIDYVAFTIKYAEIVEERINANLQ